MRKNLENKKEGIVCLMNICTLCMVCIVFATKH